MDLVETGLVAEKENEDVFLDPDKDLQKDETAPSKWLTHVMHGMTVDLSSTKLFIRSNFQSACTCV